MQLGVLVVVLARKAKVVGEPACGQAIAERIMIPLPCDLPSRIRNLVRRSKMVGCDYNGSPRDTTATGRSFSQTVSSITSPRSL